MFNPTMHVHIQEHACLRTCIYITVMSMHVPISIHMVTMQLKAGLQLTAILSRELNSYVA